MDDGSIMAIAWHNMAVEQEHLQMIEASLHSYEQAVIVAEREWGAGHIKTLAIKHSLEEARGKAAQRRQAGKSGGTNGGHGGGAAASPLDSVLNPASSTSFVNNFRQSGIKSTAGTGANKGGGGALSRSTKLKTATAARAYGPGGQQTRNRSSVSDSWGDYLNSTQMGEEGDQGGQGQGALPPVEQVEVDLVGGERHAALRQVLVATREQRRAVVGHPDVLGQPRMIALGEPFPVGLLPPPLVAKGLERLDDVGHVHLRMG